jgi:hypothetical protein
MLSKMTASWSFLKYNKRYYLRFSLNQMFNHNLKFRQTIHNLKLLPQKVLSSVMKNLKNFFKPGLEIAFQNLLDSTKVLSTISKDKLS